MNNFDLCIIVFVMMLALNSIIRTEMHYGNRRNSKWNHRRH